MKVSNFEKNGKRVPNQFILASQGVKIFQSYNNIIVKMEEDKIYLDAKYYNYSGTTSKYRNLFLGDTAKEVEQKIKSGQYILTNLN